MRQILLVLAAVPAAAQAGIELYQKHCSYCHGARGEGGRGPDLTAGRYRHAQDDTELFQVIRNGIRGTEMPAVRATDAEVRALVAHVRSLTVRDGSGSQGDAAEGEKLFARCAGCHPGTGPDLAFAATRGAAFLRDSILKPEAEIANGYRALHVTVNGGKVWSGIRLNEDDLSIQLRLAGGGLRTLLKADIVSVDRTRPSLMPDFTGQLTPAQVDNLIAYLRRLR